MTRRRDGRKRDMRRLTSGLLLLTSCLLLSRARAGIIVPEWSRPLSTAVVSTAVGASTYKTENLFLLLADGHVLAVSAVDSLREVGRAPYGATALASLPTPPRGASDIALILAVATSGACDLVAWNRNGQQLWRTAIPGMSQVDSIFFVGESENRAEFCAWQRGDPWLVNVGKQLWQYTASAVRLRPGFIPDDALICDFDRDDSPELVFFNGVQLAVYHLRQERELRCQWPEPDSTAASGAGRAAGPRIACAVFDSTPVLLVATRETLRFVNAATGEEERQIAADSASGLPGPVAAVAARGASAYAAGTDPEGRIYLARLGLSGPVRERLLLPPAPGARVNAVALLNDWPMLQVSTGYGPENLLVCAPGLAGTAGNSPQYSGVRLLRAIELRIDDDTFPDLVVLRTAGDARWRLDVFANRLGQLVEDLQRARQVLLRAALGENDNAVRRAVRRVRELERETGAGEAGQERGMVDRYQAAVQRRRLIILTGTLLAIFASLGLSVLWLRFRRRHGTPAQQIENQPIATRVALAADFIALDHNFMSKGNLPAGFERLIDIRNHHGLERDRDLGQSGGVSSQQLNGVYASAITRLIDSSPTLKLLDFVQTTVKSSPRGQDFEFLELSPEQLRRLERRPGITLVAITNHEYPDYLRQFRVFANAEVRGTLEHVILDHVRHAAKWARIITSYTVNTQWNRRLLISFRSDSPHVVPFANPHAHITSQLRELATMLRPAIEVPRDAGALVGPHERLWLSLADYIAVLEETRSRVSVP
jgi:hypothetical protein